MAASRDIASLIVVPDEDPAPDSPPPGRRSISVGIAAPGQRVAWGICLGGPYPLPIGPPPNYLAGVLRRRLLERVAPALEGQPLADFRPLAEALDQATEPLTPDQKNPDQSPGSAARFTAWVQPPAHSLAGPSPAESQANEELVRRALRYGAGGALLEAVALARGLTMAEVLTEAYGLPRPGESVPLLVVLEGLDTAPVASLVQAGVGALGFSVQKSQAHSALGEDGAIVQRFLRQVKAQTSGSAPGAAQPALHLDLQGGFGQLFAQDPGRILGALFGLQQAADPLPLHVQDPLVAGDTQAQQSRMAELQEFIRLRRMSVGLAAGAWVDSLDGVQACLQAGAASMILLDLARLGSLHQAVLAVKACQEQGVQVAVRGAPAEFPQALPLACQFALATRPDLLVADGTPGPAQDEMARTLSGLRARGG